MSTLKSGLEFFVNEVENLPEHVVFNMRRYSRCVIGQTIGWNFSKIDYNIYDSTETYILKTKFGIDTGLKRASQFSRGSEIYYTDEQWGVIKLFTTAIGDTITKNQWLVLAKEQLEQMK